VDDRHDEKPEGTEYLACGASFLPEDGTQRTRTLLSGHPSGHAGLLHDSRWRRRKRRRRLLQHQLPDQSWFGFCDQVGHRSAEGVPDHGHFVKVESVKEPQHVRAHQLQRIVPRLRTASVPTQVDCVRPVPEGQCLDDRAPGIAVLAKSVEKYNGREPGVSCGGKCQPNAVHVDA